MSGLDPLGRVLVKDIIKGLRQRGKTIFFSTHITSDVELVCDRVGVIVGGTLRAVDKVSTILESGETGYRIYTTSSNGVASETDILKSELANFILSCQEANISVLGWSPAERIWRRSSLTLFHGEWMKVSHLHSLFFLCLVVLIIYYPAVSGIYNTVDDVHIIDAYGHNGHQTLKHIFIPGNQYYFRPLIELTYYFDNWAWGLNPSSMHLENILLHILNVILVYQIASNLKSWCGYSSALPFISALLFAIHPINTEAVCWIAGRTDPLAAVFILLSVLFLVRFFQKV